ncbi:hypothetical protein [Mycetocola reblochoni]|uniref:hypothetical protein n=1 Tax=Mycetocola reblochoni TaxID=331618 RepID=UPI003F9D2107
MSVPHLVLDVHDDGTLTVTLDTRPVDPPDEVSAWRRAMFAQIIDHATNDRTIAGRVTVHESDGTTFTDILPAAKRPAPDSEPEEKPEPRRAVKRQRAADPISVDGGDGFIAGEDVAVALITAHTDATPDGRARALLDPAVVAAARAGEVVLVGRVSGTIAVRSLK